MNVPVAFFVFNRPSVTEQVFARIAAARPPILFVVADGPRPDRSGEAAQCERVRSLVERVEWPCRVIRHYADSNLGCAVRVFSGVDRIFEEVEECIFLEDDCLPSPSFFLYAEEMLERYQHDERIMHINGYSYQFGVPRTTDSYYFCRSLCSWGWATWRRAWQHYDFRISLWPELRETSWLKTVVANPLTVRWNRDLFDLAHAGKLWIWDAQWTFAVWTQSGLAISPQDDLIRNIGFGADATNTKELSSRFDRGPMDLTFPLRHPTAMLPHTTADRFCTDHIADLYLHLHRRRSVRALSTVVPNVVFRFAAEVLDRLGLSALI